jgi:hypothetical protein
VPSREFAHLLLTRFNVLSEERVKPPSDAWLRERLDIFKAWCLPSVRGQLVRPDAWLIFCDQSSPAWFLDELRGSLVEREEVVLVAGAATPEFYSKIVDNRSTESAFIITTRLDNDDAIASDYIQMVQDRFSFQDLEFINFSLGAQYANGRLYARLDPSNAFLSLIERRSIVRPKTVFIDWHNRVDRHGRVRRLWTHYAWLQNVHGGNLANVVRGIPVRSTAVMKYFSISIPVLQISRVVLLRDAIINLSILSWRVVWSGRRLKWLFMSIMSKR